MTPSARALCEALSAAHVRVHAPDRTRLIVNPAKAVTPALADLLRRYKPELIGALNRLARRGLDASLAPCQACNSEFVHASERLCPWCEVTAHNECRIEARQIETASAHGITVQTVPATPESGQLDSLDRKTANRSRARAHRQNPETRSELSNRPETVRRSA